MTTQTTYQQLRSSNLHAAYAIAELLKEKKCLSEESFGRSYAKETGIRYKCHGSFDKLMCTTKNFLIQHKVMTFVQINGLNFWIATKKCVYTKVENMFIEYQRVDNNDIDKAIEYQTLNGGMVPPEVEGTVIAKNILGLTGSSVKSYATAYVWFYVTLEVQDLVGMKFAVINPLRMMNNIKKY